MQDSFQSSCQRPAIERRTAVPRWFPPIKKAIETIFDSNPILLHSVLCPAFTEHLFSWYSE